MSYALLRKACVALFSALVVALLLMNRLDAVPFVVVGGVLLLYVVRRIAYSGSILFDERDVYIEIKASSVALRLVMLMLAGWIIVGGMLPCLGIEVPEELREPVPYISVIFAVTAIVHIVVRAYFRSRFT